MAAHTQIGQHAVHLPHSIESQVVLQVAKILTDQRKPWVVDGVFTGVGILVEGQQTAVWPKPFHDGSRVPTTPKGYINIDPRGVYV